MNLLMYYNNVDVSMFKDKDRKISSFEILSQILPPISAVDLQTSCLMMMKIKKHQTILLK